MKTLYRMTSRYLAVAALMAVGIATTISSGGGGGGGANPPPPPPSGNEPTLTITADNGDDVAATLLIAAGFTFDIGDISGGGVVAQASPRLLSDVIRKNTSVLNSTTRSQLEPCLADGTVEVTATLANPPQLTVGDQIIMVFDNCDDNEGYVISGTVDLTVAALQGDPLTNVFLVGFDALVTDVVITEGTDSFTADGDFRLTLDSLNFPVITMTIAGQQLAFGVGTNTTTLTDFDHSITVDAGVFPDTKTADAFGRLQDVMLGGSVDYQTTALIHAIGDFDPHEGEILVTGANNTTVRIVVVDNSTVRLEIDTNGDGVVDSFVDTSWSGLTGGTPPGVGSTINSTNLPIVAREVFNAVTGFGSVTAAAGGQFTQDGVFTLVQQQGVSGDFGPLTIDCLTGGTADVSGSIATAGVYSTGDTLSATFAACQRSGEKLDGGMQFAVDSFSGAVGEFMISVTGTAIEANLRRGADGTCHIGLGSLVTQYDIGFIDTRAVTVSGAAATFDISAGGRHQLLSNASVGALIAIGPPGTITRDSSGTFEGTDLVGTYSYMSIAPDVFVLDGDPATGPSSGELLVTAGDGSSMRLVAVDNMNVRLDADYNGDSVIDERVFTTYSTLGYGNVFGMCDLPIP